MLQGLVVVWGAGVGVFLLTASAREYRVVMEPGEERLLGCGHTCQHPDTNTSFSLGEECTQWADNFTQVDIPLRFISQRFFRVELRVWCLVANLGSFNFHQTSAGAHV